MSNRAQQHRRDQVLPSHSASVERAGPSAQLLTRQALLVLDRILGEVSVGTASGGTAVVELCKRPADIPILKQIGIQHWWIRGTGLEAGMGKKGAGVPGRLGGSAPTLRTTINDHSGEGNRRCPVAC